MREKLRDTVIMMMLLGKFLGIVPILLMLGQPSCWHGGTKKIAEKQK